VYREDVAERILTQIAAGKSLPKICAQSGMPKKETVCTWIWRNHNDFGRRYFEAFGARVALMAQEAVDIVDESVGRDMAGVTCARNRADMRKWLLSHLFPERFGDRIDHQHLLSGSAEIRVYLPSKQSRGQLLDGTATEVLEDDSGSS
jgi:hypothetical protein